MIRPLHPLLLTATLCLAAVPSAAEEPSLPVIDGKEALATVNGDPVTWDEFEQQLSFLHQGAAEGAKVRRQQPYELLERLINIKLLLQEARNIGLDELPELVRAMEAFREETLRSLLIQRQLTDLTRPDGAEVERRYRETVRQIRAKSVLVDKEDDARRLEESVRNGGDFDDLAAALVQEGKARSDAGADFLKVEEMFPEARAALVTLQPGQVSPLVRVGQGFAMLRLLEVRYPEDPVRKDEIEKEVLLAERNAAAKKYAESLRDKYARIRKDVLDSVDFESAPSGGEDLEGDSRAVAEIKGEAPVTVGDLAEALRSKFFHGTERPAQQRKLNMRKPAVLDELMIKRVLLKEARRLKIQDSERFRATVRDQEDGVLFGTFVARVVDPDIRVGEEDLKQYLAGHRSEFSTPEMRRVDILAFSQRERADEAVAKLRQGADFQWMRQNADGQVDPQTLPELAEIPGRLLMDSQFPPEMRKALAGTEAGDVRFHGSDEGPFLALYVRQVVPSREQSLEQVKEVLSRRVFQEKREAAIDDWAEKLREAYDVKIFVTKEQIERLLGIVPARPA